MPSSSAVPQPRGHMLCVSALTLVLDLWGITRENSMWRDEAATWAAVHRTVPQLGNMLGQIDVVHGLYYLFMHGVFQLFGDSLYTLRLPSVVATTCTAAVIVLLGSRLAGRYAGLAAGLSFALVPAVQQYAQEGRPYALVMLCVALASWLLVVSIDDPTAGHWAAYGAVALTAALLNWFSLLMLTAHAVSIVMTRPARRIVRRWAVTACTVVLCASPLIVASQAQSQQIAWIPPVKPSTLLSLLLTLFAGLACAWGARAETADRAAHGAQPTLTAVALPLLGLPPLLLLVVSFAQPVYQTRYVLFGYLGLALLIGGACQRLTKRFRGSSQRIGAAVMAIAFVCLLPVQISMRSSSSRIDDVLFTTHDVAAVREPGDRVLYIPAARRDTALVSPTAFTDAQDIALAQDPYASGTLYGRERSPREIADAMLAADRIIVVSTIRCPRPRQTVTGPNDRSSPTTSSAAQNQEVTAARSRCTSAARAAHQAQVYVTPVMPAADHQPSTAIPTRSATSSNAASNRLKQFRAIATCFDKLAVHLRMRGGRRETVTHPQPCPASV
ncbi:glycosyltransferase family 39 protein [Streptomyces flaveolus]|uniref:glycosyltransferase family 39 protein n=1 Tax=Streptomyces flaveolus TaxID=67297 RepID=UPI003702F286